VWLKGELVRLALSDVDVQHGLLTVRHGKGDKYRQVRVGKQCRQVLWTYIHKYRAATDCERLFLSHTGDVLTGNAVTCMFQRFSEVLGFRVYAHKFRHTFATNLARQVPNAFLVAQALGHSDINTAAGYVHLAQSDTVDVSPMDIHLSKRS